MTKEELIIKEALNYHIDAFELPEGCAPVDISGIKELIKTANFTDISLKAIYEYMLMIEHNVLLGGIIVNRMGDAFESALSSVGVSDSTAKFASDIWKLILCDFIKEAFNIDDDE